MSGVVHSGPMKLIMQSSKLKAVAGLNNEKTYSFPSQSPRYSEVVTLEDEVKEDPLSALQNQTELLSTTVQNLQAIPTFGKLRLIIEHKFLRNSNQIDLEQAKNHWFLEYALKSETENKKAEYWGETYAARAMDLDLANRISTWDTYAMEALTAEPPTVSPDEIIIFPPNVITQAFVPVIAHHASANARLEGTSNFDEIGKQVAQSDFTIWDDGLLEGGLDTAPWDGEGLPQQATPIISDGVFQNWLYDQRHALIYNVDSTGNGVRGRTGQIVNDIHNLKSSVGSGLFEDLLKDVDHGLLINQFSWLNPSELSGSFGAEIRNGYEIEEGALTKPVKGGVVSGNIFAMLKDISGMTFTTQIAPARDGTAGDVSRGWRLKI